MSNDNILPSQFQNNVAFIDPAKDKELPEQVAAAPDFEDELNNIISDDEKLDDLLVDESLVALGGELEIAGIKLPPPTAGVLMLLEVIESPFTALEPPESITLDEIIRSLWIIINRENAVQTVTDHVQALKSAKYAFEKTEKTPEHLAVYFDFIERMNELDDFDAQIAEFAISLGPLDPVEAAAKIAKYLKICMGGYALLPESGNACKKKDISTQNG